MAAWLDRAGNVLDHDPFLCDSQCYQTHDMPGPADPPYTGYALVLARAAGQSPSEWTFKHEPRFVQITEHVPPDQAEAMLACVREEFPDHWPLVERHLPALIKSNDSLGQPALLDVAGLRCSPTNFRYLYHAMLCLDRLKSVLHHGHNTFHVIELGGGYGGLAYYFSELSALFELAAKTYTIVDLPDATLVQHKYAQALGFPLRTVDGTNSFILQSALIPVDGLPRFFISAYAFAEFDVGLQRYYSQKLIEQCQHGWLAWNYAANWLHRPPNPVYPFTERPMVVEQERPPAFGLQGHSFVWF